MGSPGKATVSKSGYRAYIRSPEWAAVRRRYWNSKMPKECFVCGKMNRPMDLHHRTYKNLGNERLMDLVPVHRDCHNKIHKFDKAREDRRGGLWAATATVKKRARPKPPKTEEQLQVRAEKREKAKLRQKEKKARKAARASESPSS